MAGETPDAASIAKAALEDMAYAFLGKKGRLRQLIEPRIAQSGYFHLRAHGTGELAGAIGTMVEPVLTGMSKEKVPAANIVTMARADIERMGALEEFLRSTKAAPKGYAWGLSAAYPAQDAAHTQTVLIKMVEHHPQGVIGYSSPGLAIRLRDIDTDRAPISIITGNLGQRLLAAFGFRHSIPEAVEQAKIYEASLSAESKILSDLGIEAHEGIVHFRDMMKAAGDKATLAAHEAEYLTQVRAQQFYSTKELMGSINRWAREMKWFMQYDESASGRRNATAVLSAIEQYGTMAKGQQIAQAAKELASIESSLSLEVLRGQAFEETLVDKTIRNIKALREMAGTQGHIAAMTESEAKEAAMAFLRTARQKRIAMAGDASLPSTIMQLAFNQRPETGQEALEKIVRSLGVTEQVMAEATETGYGQMVKTMSELSGLSAAQAEMVAGSALTKIEHQGVAAANKTLVEAGNMGRDIPTPVIDSIVNWFRDPEVMNVHKAAVIGGAALLGAAIVKNAFFPSYVPFDAEGPAPVHTLVPVPMHLPPEIPEHVPLMDTIPDTNLPMGIETRLSGSIVPMGTRTPMPAVESGIGMKRPVDMPAYSGPILREPPPAPVVLNQERYGAPVGSPVPPTVRVAAPEEGMASYYRPRGLQIQADIPDTFNVNDMMYDILPPQATVRIETMGEESDYAILSAIAASEESSYT